MNDQTYRWNAEEYEKYSSAQYDWARELIEKLHLNGAESVLDIGCGDGKVTAMVAAFVPQGEVMGIDNSEGMIALAGSRFPKSIYRNLAFCLMDVRAIESQNEFDIAFSNAALHWIRDHSEMLARVRKSLKRNGRLLFQMGGKGNAGEILAILNEMESIEPWCPYLKAFPFPYGFYGPEEYSTWLADAGLRAKRVELIPKEMKHRDKDGLAGWIRTTWLPYIERVPLELKEGFISEITERYLKAHPPDNEGNIRVKMVRLEIEAING